MSLPEWWTCECELKGIAVSTKPSPRVKKIFVNDQLIPLVINCHCRSFGGIPLRSPAFPYTPELEKNPDIDVIYEREPTPKMEPSNAGTSVDEQPTAIDFQVKQEIEEPPVVPDELMEQMQDASSLADSGMSHSLMEEAPTPIRGGRRGMRRLRGKGRKSNERMANIQFEMEPTEGLVGIIRTPDIPNKRAEKRHIQWKDEDANDSLTNVLLFDHSKEIKQELAEQKMEPTRKRSAAKMISEGKKEGKRKNVEEEPEWGEGYEEEEQREEPEEKEIDEEEQEEEEVDGTSTTAKTHTEAAGDWISECFQQGHKADPIVLGEGSVEVDKEPVSLPAINDVADRGRKRSSVDDEKESDDGKEEEAANDENPRDVDYKPDPILLLASERVADVDVRESPKKRRKKMSLVDYSKDPRIVEITRKLEETDDPFEKLELLKMEQEIRNEGRVKKPEKAPKRSIIVKEEVLEEQFDAYLAKYSAMSETPSKGDKAKNAQDMPDIENLLSGAPLFAVKTEEPNEEQLNLPLPDTPDQLFEDNKDGIVEAAQSATCLLEPAPLPEEVPPSPDCEIIGQRLAKQKAVKKISEGGEEGGDEADEEEVKRGTIGIRTRPRGRPRGLMRKEEAEEKEKEDTGTRLKARRIHGLRGDNHKRLVAKSGSYVDDRTRVRADVLVESGSDVEEDDYGDEDLCLSRGTSMEIQIRKRLHAAAVENMQLKRRVKEEEKRARNMPPNIFREQLMRRFTPSIVHGPLGGGRYWPVGSLPSPGKTVPCLESLLWARPFQGLVLIHREKRKGVFDAIDRRSGLQKHKYRYTREDVVANMEKLVRSKLLGTGTWSPLAEKVNPIHLSEVTSRRTQRAPARTMTPITIQSKTPSRESIGQPKEVWVPPWNDLGELEEDDEEQQQPGELTSIGSALDFIAREI